MAEIKDINVLTVRGRIGAKYAPPERQWLSTAIAINRQGVEATDFPGIYWYGDMADYVEENFAKGDSVVVKAIMGRNVDQPFIGVEIMPTKRLFDEKFGLDTQRGPYPNDFSEALLMGEVTRVFRPEKIDDRKPIGYMSIVTRINNRAYQPSVTCFGKNCERLAEIEAGDRVCVIAHVSTYVREDQTEPRRRHGQSIVCRYIEKLAR